MAEENEPISGNSPLASVLGVSNLPSGLKGKAQRIFLRFLAGSLAHPYVRQGLLQGDGDATKQLRTVAAHIDKTNITMMYLPKVITDGKEIAPEEQLWPK